MRTDIFQDKLGKIFFEVKTRKMQTEVTMQWFGLLDELTGIIIPSILSVTALLLFCMLLWARGKQRVKPMDLLKSMPAVLFEIGLTTVVFLQGLASVTDAMTKHKLSSSDIQFSTCDKSCPSMCSAGLTPTQVRQVKTSFIILGSLIGWNVVAFILLTVCLQLSTCKTKYDNWKIVKGLKNMPKFLVGKGLLLVAAIFAEQYIYALTLPVAVIYSYFSTSTVHVYNITLIIAWLSLFYFLILSVLSPQAMFLSLGNIIRTTKKCSVSKILYTPMVALILCAIHILKLALGIPDVWVAFNLQRKRPELRLATYSTLEFFSGYAATFLMTIPFVGPYFYLVTTAFSKSAFWLHQYWLYPEPTPATKKPRAATPPSPNQGTDVSVADQPNTESQPLIVTQQPNTTSVNSTTKKKAPAKKTWVIKVDSTAKLSEKQKLQKLQLILFIPLISLIAFVFPHGVNFKEMVLCDLLKIKCT